MQVKNIIHSRRALSACLKNNFQQASGSVPVSQRTFFSLPELPNFGPFSSSNGHENNTTTFHERKILPYSQRELWTLVADVDSYEHFIPYCKASRVLSSLPRTIHSGITYDVEAELTVGFLAFEESYVSKVTCTPYEMVKATGKSNLFESLTTTWRFQPASASSPHLSKSPPPDSSSPLETPSADSGPTLLSIDLSYQFSNPLHAHVAGHAFGQVSQLMVTAFEKRCLEVYGPGTK